MFYEVFFYWFWGVAFLNVIYNNCLRIDNIALTLSMGFIALSMRDEISLILLRKLSLVKTWWKILLWPLRNWIPMRLVLSKLKLRFRAFKLLNSGGGFLQHFMNFTLNLFEIVFALLIWNMPVNLFNLIGNFGIEIL